MTPLEHLMAIIHQFPIEDDWRCIVLTNATIVMTHPTLGKAEVYCDGDDQKITYFNHNPYELLV